MTEKPPTVVEALTACMTDVQAIKKGDRNTQQNYSFRGIDAVMNAVGPVFRAHGVIAVPCRTEAAYRDVQTSTGKPSRECTVTVTYRFYGPAGDYIEAQVPGESMDFGDKGAAKAMAVAYRILLLQALCVPTDDAEPDAGTYERAARPPIEQVARETALQRSIREAAGKLGIHTWTDVAADFTTRNPGLTMRDANEEALLQFLADLRDEYALKGQAEAGQLNPA